MKKFNLIYTLMPEALEKNCNLMPFLYIEEKAELFCVVLDQII